MPTLALSLLESNHECRLTNSDLDVVPSGGVLEVVDGAQHVQGHVTDVVGMEGGLIGHACHHHVSIANCLHLDQHRGTKSDYDQSISPHLVGQLTGVLLGLEPWSPDGQYTNRKHGACRRDRNASFFLTNLVNIVLFTQCVEDDVDLIEHVHHLHGGDVDADLVELDHVAEQDGDIWEDLFEKV